MYLIIYKFLMHYLMHKHYFGAIENYTNVSNMYKLIYFTFQCWRVYWKDGKAYISVIKFIYCDVNQTGIVNSIFHFIFVLFIELCMKCVSVGNTSFTRYFKI